MRCSTFPLAVLAIVALVARQSTPCEGANILGLFTSSSPSHLIIHMSVMKVLAERGHNVTVITSQQPKVNHKDIKVIVIPPDAAKVKILDEAVANMAKTKTDFWTTMRSFFGPMQVLLDMQVDLMRDHRLTSLYDDPGTKIDLVIVGYFMNEYAFGAAAKFKAPLAISWSGPPGVLTDRFIGNPTDSSYIPNMNMAVAPGKKMTFLQRLQNLISNIILDMLMTLLNLRTSGFYKELFPTDGSFPTLEEIKKNVSLVFVNAHFSEGVIKPNVPALVEIGGIQVKDKMDPLPKDISDFLDGAKEHGAILFSLGSNLKGSTIKAETATYIFNVLSKLKQRVIWKWEDLEHTPGKSANILYKKWMPQDDILAHPNLRLFITHAGRGGLTEATYHGVPMLALPVFADQHNNAKSIVNSGYGLELELLSVTEDNLKAAVSEILTNPSYAAKVRQFSSLYRDRPLTARESVAFWVEYVIRHHGAHHMQSPLVHMNFIETLNLDVLALLVLIFYVLYRIFRLGFVFVYRKLCGKSCKKSQKVKKQ